MMNKKDFLYGMLFFTFVFTFIYIFTDLTFLLYVITGIFLHEFGHLLFAKIKGTYKGIIFGFNKVGIRTKESDPLVASAGYIFTIPIFVSCFINHPWHLFSLLYGFTVGSMKDFLTIIISVRRKKKGEN